MAKWSRKITRSVKKVSKAIGPTAVIKPASKLLKNKNVQNAIRVGAAVYTGGTSELLTQGGKMLAGRLLSPRQARSYGAEEAPSPESSQAQTQQIHSSPTQAQSNEGFFGRVSDGLKETFGTSGITSQGASVESSKLNLKLLALIGLGIFGAIFYFRKKRA